jgi:hypothetical protein
LQQASKASFVFSVPPSPCCYSDVPMIILESTVEASILPPLEIAVPSLMV